MSIFARSVRAPSGNSPARIRWKQVEVLRHRAVPVGALLPRPVGRAAHLVHLLGRVVADVGLALADQLERVLVERLEVVGGVERLQRFTAALRRHDRGEVVVLATPQVALLRRPTDRLQAQTVVRPAGDEPLHVRRDGVDVLDVLLGRIGVVHAQVALPAELAGDAEVQADGLGVADVEVAVGLRRETRHHAADAARGQVLLDHLPEEVLALLASAGPGVTSAGPAWRPCCTGHLCSSLSSPTGIKASSSHNPLTESRSPVVRAVRPVRLRSSHSPAPVSYYSHGRQSAT